jgi:hypothetical protein
MPGFSFLRSCASRQAIDRDEAQMPARKNGDFADSL